ncbi:hypothetical protein [Spiroplasma sp. DGKH1]|uniref:hypothetical protein n=1 Tax=Spiroplasma sp. DGKH1 TaxID=3050074 RepID=UPI0034C61C3B
MMKWEPEQTISILKEYVYSKNKLDEYRNRVALSNIELPPFYVKDDEEQSVSAIAVRIVNRKQIIKSYDKKTADWLFATLNNTIMAALQKSDKIFGIHKHDDLYLAVYEDDGSLDYLIDIVNYINTTVRIMNFNLYEDFTSVKEVKIGVGIANDPKKSRIEEVDEDEYFTVPIEEVTKDCVATAEYYAAETVMFNNLPVCTDAWVYYNLSEESQELIRKNMRQYFNSRMVHQRLFTNLIDNDIKKQIDQGNLKIDDE